MPPMVDDARRAPRTIPVKRDRLFRSELLEIRDNRCGRHDPALSPETPPLAWHEITLPRRGLWLRHLGREALPVDRLHVHFLNRGESHRVSHPLGCGDANTGLVVAATTLCEVMTAMDHRATPERPFLRTHARLDARADAAHRLLLAAVRADELEPLAIDELALRLLANVLRSGGVGPHAPAPLRRSQRDVAEQALAVLHQRLGEPLALVDVACAVGSSPFHLCRVFTAHFGTSLHRYRQSLRLSAALDLVVDGSADLAAIAAATGFSDRSHLSRLFTRRFGLSPSQLRERRRPLLRRDGIRELLGPA